MYASSLVGVGERPLSLVAPIYSQRSTVGQGVRNALGHTPGKLVDVLIGESPQLSYVDNVIGAGADIATGDPNADRSALSLVPGVGIFKNYLTPYER